MEILRFAQDDSGGLRTQRAGEWKGAGCKVCVVVGGQFLRRVIRTKTSRAIITTMATSPGPSSTAIIVSIDSPSNST